MNRMYRGINSVTEYILSLFPETVHDSNFSSISQLSFIIQQFIRGEISYEDCCQYSLSIGGTSAPIEKLRSIMSVPEEPIKSEAFSDDSPKKKSRSWSSYEDDRLIMGILRFGSENWTSISLFIGNSRNRSQCSQRWFRGLDPRLSKEQWTIEEDNHLLQLVYFFGVKSWTQIALKMGNRSDVQCRYRYKQLQRNQTPHMSPKQMMNLPPPTGVRKAASINLPQFEFPPPEVLSQHSETSFSPPQQLNSTYPLPHAPSPREKPIHQQPDQPTLKRSWNPPNMQGSFSASALPRFQPLNPIEQEEAKEEQKARFQETMQLFTGDFDEDETSFFNSL